MASVKIKGKDCTPAKPLELELACMKDGTPFLRGYHPRTGKKHRIAIFRDTGIEIRSGNSGIGLPTDSSGRVVVRNA